jgi:flagellar basal body-associated protein FliL
MSTETILILIITGGVHLLGIGIFILWMMSGYPLSFEAFRKNVKKVHFLPRWHN